MAKTTWRTKAMYIVFALALVFGLSLTAAMPTQQVAEASIPDEGHFDMTGGNITLTGTDTDPEALGEVSGYFTGTCTGIQTGPYYALMNFLIDPNTPTVPGDDIGGGFAVKVWIQNNVGTSDRIDFSGIYASDDGLITGSFLVSATVPITIGEDGAISGAVNLVQFGVMVMSGYIGIPEIIPSLAMDVKGSTQKFILINLPLWGTDEVTGEYTEYWGLGEQLFEQIVETNDPTEQYPQQNPITGIGPLDYPEGLPEMLGLWQTLIGYEIQWWDYAVGVALTDANVIVMDGGEKGDPFIELFSRAPGDLAVFAGLLWVGPSGVEQEIVVESAEKKWGVIDHTVLDLHPESPETPLDPQETWSADAGTEAYPEIEFFSDFVYAWYFWGEGVPTPIHVDTAGHAIVHWWLIQDDAAGLNEAAIQDVMDYLNEDPGCEGDCPGCGRYDPYPPAKSPFDRVNDVWIDNEAEFTTFTNIEDGYYYLLVSPDQTYIKTVTQDDFPGETRGLTMVTTKNVGGEDILVVTLTEYPDEFNGENPVCVEIGWKSYGVPPPPEYVKTPQLAWAGQKVVLEQDWSAVIDSGEQYTAIYHLESQSVGEISVGGDNVAIEYGANEVYVLVNTTNSTSEILLESEVQGEADINVKLYEGWFGTQVAFDLSALDSGYAPIINYGFLVYYMAFEDVIVPDGDGNVPDTITPSADMENVMANVDVNFAVQVRGWFKSDQLPGTSRPAVDTNDDFIYELPPGRYVMPDDWWALAGYSYSLRPNWDLMDSPEDDITSTDTGGAYLDSGVLGPFDTGVRTTDPPAEAEFPSVGPFSTLQRWSTDLMWIAEAATVPTSLSGENHRNTVVPDGWGNWYDAPMPQGLVIFRITSYSTRTDLSELLKGDLEGYGIIGDEYQSPFYAAEVPSSEFIPAIDYNWNSWGLGGDGPYPYWTDLMIKSINDDEAGLNTPAEDVNTQDIEVYCDNHGIAAMTVDGVNQGTVTVQAIAEYPAAFKKGKYGPVYSDETTINWGAIEMDPFFLANKIVVDVEELVTFDNLTMYGKAPYTKAEWDFDNDGVFEVTKTGSHAQVTASVTHAYTEPGIYAVKLQMTDSAPTTRFEIRLAYITVGTPPGAVVTVDLPFGTDGFAWAINQIPFPGSAIAVTLADVEDTMPDVLSRIWYYNGVTGEWQYYVPGLGAYNTLTQLVPGKVYTFVVTTATEWDIPQE